MANLPDRGTAAALAIAKDTVVGGAHVGFQTGVIDFFDRLTSAADQLEEAKFPFDG